MWYWDAHAKIIRYRYRYRCLNRFLSVNALVGAFSVIVKTSRTFVSSSNEDGGCCAARSYVLTIAITWPSACSRAGLVTRYSVLQQVGTLDTPLVVTRTIAASSVIPGHPLHSAVYIHICQESKWYSQCCSDKHTTGHFRSLMLHPLVLMLWLIV